MAWNSSAGRPVTDVRVDNYSYKPMTRLRHDNIDLWDDDGFVLEVGRGYDAQLLMEVRGREAIRQLAKLCQAAVDSVETEVVLHDET